MYQSSPTVRDYMLHKVLYFNVRDDVADIAATLLERNMRGAPVLDETGKVVGFVSEQDCIKEMLNTAWHCDQTATAADVMHREVLSVNPEMDISDLAQQLCQPKPKIYPVIEDGRMIGLITRSEVLKALVEQSAKCHHPTTQANKL
jgi:predicted transcriptional regulator